MSSNQEFEVIDSPKSVDETIDKIKKDLESKGIKIFAHINHAQEARTTGLALADEQLLVFGDPKVGTFLMQENPLIGIELPLKILVWSDQGKTKVAYPNPTTWQKRFSITKQAPVLEKMLQLLGKIAQS